MRRARADHPQNMLLLSRGTAAVASLCAFSLLGFAAVAGADTRFLSDPPNAQQADPIAVTHGHAPRQRDILFHRLATRQAVAVQGVVG